MMPITWPGFGGIHPFAPAAQARQATASLSPAWSGCSSAVTGFAAVSLQPNAGSQGEYAGLLVIRRYHESRGEGGRNVCLIPSSAHGTNPASAVMAGMSVWWWPATRTATSTSPICAPRPEVHADDLAALMITYPSTHGVFEESIVEICEVIHAAGGQVYMDGANLNALVGLSKPGQFGPDVAHLNLHKTFCIPHGGGGPGVGPIGVAAHLAPFLPGHPLVPESGPEGGIGPVSGGALGLRPASCRSPGPILR